ncbi:hypothetical protein [Flavihumibacter sp. UBA7668]|uniref:hypothetical protein n=1 Tax=Flavihumibacter sp. UBA7668 TaxID=1946542 RepID=UPI0025C631DB|nr:hypothetical protein [Flavihumibacter sp. UBA7668]
MIANCFAVVIFSVVFHVEQAFAQPIIVEDRNYLKVSADVVKLEQDIYHPKFPGKQLDFFTKWEYVYKNGLPESERSFTARKSLWTEKNYFYNDQGKLIKDSCWDPSFTQFNNYTIYEYNKDGLLAKAIQTGSLSGKIGRIDTYSKYKQVGTYQITSTFYGDDQIVKYTSVYEDGLKRMVIHSKGFLPVKYTYDADGRLLTLNNRKFYYKLDTKGNPIASVQIERGMRIYHFMRLTYSDGSITGTLEPDVEFINNWDKQQ